MDNFVIFHIEGGIGKSIIATAVIKSIKASYKEHKIIIVTNYPEVFIHNPNVYRVYKIGQVPYFYENYIKDKNSIILKLDPYNSGDFVYKRKHLSEIWCDLFKIPCVDKRPEIFLTSREVLYANSFLEKKGPILIIQTNGGAENQKYHYSWARDLPYPFAQDLVNDLKKYFDKILHISRKDQLTLKDTIKVTDNFRNIFSYIALADKIIGIDSFVQHAAAALNKKATVGWIYSSPTVFGHKIHDNIISNENKQFRHEIDSYLELNDWSGTKFYECPYNDLSKIFNKNIFINSILK